MFGNRERLLPARAARLLPRIHGRDARARATAARAGSSAAAMQATAPGGLFLYRRPLHAASAGSCRDRRPTDFFHDSRRNVTMLLQTVRPNIVQSIRAYRVDDLMQAAQTRRPALPVREPDDGPDQAGRARRHRRAFTVPGALRQEPRCAVRLHDRPGAQGRARSPASSSCSSSCRTTRASTARRASSCSTSSATRPTSGPNARYRSGASILFSSPLPGTRVMGAGDGNGPERQRTSRSRRPSKSAANSSFGMNMPLMSSAFDTAMWLNAA